jgi:acetyl-CoA C-acetyltransferase
VGTTGVWILGGYQSDFARNLSREGLSIADLVQEVVDGALDDAKVDTTDIGTIHFGNAFGELFTGQAHLGAMPATINSALWGVPACRHEAACASGSVAVLAAMADIEAGRYDAVLVVGAELERNVPAAKAPEHLGAAAWIGHEGEEAKFIWPYLFSAIAEEYDLRYGLDEAHLHAIAELNFRNARSNPLAQTRNWTFTDRSFSDDDVANPVVEGRLRRSDCGQITDGGAGVVLASDRFLRDRRCRDHSIPPRIAGWGHATTGLSLAQKLERSRGLPYVFPEVRRAVQDAFRRAELSGVDDLDGIETHDCFTISEYVALDHLGIVGPGEGWKVIEGGDLERDGAIPVNPSGGLIGTGHPVGATGVRMLLDASRQVSGRASGYQVEGARRFATLNIGGSFTTTVSFVVEGSGQ